MCIVHNDGPQWRELTGEFEGMRRKVVVDGRRILDREKKEGLELVVLDG